jgi:hypothetical protein
VRPCTASPPELSAHPHPVAEGVVPGCVAGIASEARCLEVSSSAVDEAELPPAAAVCTQGTDGLANQRLEYRREGANVPARGPSKSDALGRIRANPNGRCK